MRKRAGKAASQHLGCWPLLCGRRQDAVAHDQEAVEAKGCIDGQLAGCRAEQRWQPPAAQCASAVADVSAMWLMCRKSCQIAVLVTLPVSAMFAASPSWHDTAGVGAGVEM